MDSFVALLDQIPPHQLRQWLDSTQYQGVGAVRYMGQMLSRLDPEIPVNEREPLYRWPVYHIRNLVHQDIELARAFHEAVFDPAGMWDNCEAARTEASKQLWQGLAFSNLDPQTIQQCVEAWELQDEDIALERWAYKGGSSAVIRWALQYRPSLLQEPMQVQAPLQNALLASAARKDRLTLQAVLELHPQWGQSSDEDAKILLDVVRYVQMSMDDIVEHRDSCIVNLLSFFPSNACVSLERLNAWQLQCLNEELSSEIRIPLFRRLLSQSPKTNWRELGEIQPKLLQQWMNEGLPVLQFRNANGDTLVHLACKSEYNPENLLQWLALQDPSLFIARNQQGQSGVDLMRQINPASLGYIADVAERTHVALQAHSLDQATEVAPSISARPRM